MILRCLLQHGFLLNYRIHTDAIKDNLIPPELTLAQVAYTYANEADMLNVVLFGNEKMNGAYRVAVYNHRGVFSPYYPKTAKIFYGLYETYKKDSERERKDAENGWY